MKLGQIEIFLIQIIVYSLIYLGDSYVGFLICLVMGCIAFALLILSFVFEFIEKSKVPKAYFWFMLNASIAPIVVLLCFSLFVHGSFDWMKE